MIEDIRQRLKDHQPLKAGREHLDRQRAAVLVPVIPDPDSPRVLLTERASSLGSHGGEVAFPGGKKDTSDLSLTDTALRETHEEIGLSPGEVEVIGELKPFVSKFGLLVTPYVGIVRPGISYRLNPHEIAAIFEVPVSYLLQDPRIRTDVISRHGQTHHVPAYEYEGHEIWGLTAMILLEFLSIGVHHEPLTG